MSSFDSLYKNLTGNIKKLSVSKSPSKLLLNKLLEIRVKSRLEKTVAPTFRSVGGDRVGKISQVAGFCDNTFSMHLKKIQVTQK